MLKIFFVSIIICVTQVNCSWDSNKKNISGLWYYVFNANTSSENTNPEGFLYLQPDSSYTRDFGKFDFGKWSINNSELLLKSERGQTIFFPIKHISAKELQLLSANGSTLRFEKQPTKFASRATDPFSIENNQWRIPAISKENDPEIKSRLKNHFKFHVVYFQWALQTGFNNINVRSTPSPIKIYANGFALKEFNDLPDAWRSYFYDKEDCQKANDMIKTIFRKHDIFWKKNNNRFEMFISAFQQLVQKIDQ